MKIQQFKVGKLFCSFLLFLALNAATSGGSSVPTLTSHDATGIAVATASGCDGGMPPPDLDCPAFAPAPNS